MDEQARQAMADLVPVYSGRVLRSAGGTGHVAPAAPEAPPQPSIEERMAAEVSKRVEAHREALEEQFTAKLLEARAAMRGDLHEAANQMTEIVGSAVERIIGAPDDPETVAAAVRRALDDHPGRDELMLRVSPKMLSRLELVRSSADENDILHSIRLVGDPVMDDARCVLEAGSERYEVGIRSQLAAFRNALRRATGESLTGHYE